MKIHIELTSRCTLGCLVCNRTLFPNSFQVSDLDWNVLKNITSNPKFDFFVFSGVNGDPIFYPKLLEWLKFRNQYFPEKNMHFETAIGGKTQKWWEEFFSLMLKNDTFCVSIDGLGEANEKYRIRSNWQHIDWVLHTSKKRKDIIKIWKWIVFGFNEHQLQEGKAYAKSLGYKFQIAKTRPIMELENQWLMPLHENLEFYKKQLL